MAPHRRILSGSAKHHHERQQMFLARMSEASEWKAVPMRDPLRPALGVRVSNSVGQRRVPISRARRHMRTAFAQIMKAHPRTDDQHALITKRRSEEHTSELQSLMRNSYAVFCLKKKKKNKHTTHTTIINTPKKQ